MKLKLKLKLIKIVHKELSLLTTWFKAKKQTLHLDKNFVSLSETWWSLYNHWKQ